MHRFIVAGLALLLAWTPLAWAQAGDQPVQAEEEWEEYEAKYLMTAAALPLIAPSLGHLYAGDWERSANVVGLRFVFLFGFNYGQALGASTARGRGMTVASAIGFATATAWECYDAYKTAKEWNEGEFEEYEEYEEAESNVGLGVDLGLADRTPTMYLTLRWF